MVEFIKKGDAPLTDKQIDNIALNQLNLMVGDEISRTIESVKNAAQHRAKILAWEQSIQDSKTINDFNKNLKDYKKALTRLERPEIPNVSNNIGNGSPRRSSPFGSKVLKRKKGDPKIVTNSFIKDRNERIEAQAVIDATPQEVKDFVE